MTHKRNSHCRQHHVDKAWEYVNGGYLSECDEEVPTNDGLALYLGVARATPYNWAKQDSNEFADDFVQINDTLQASQHVKTLTKMLRNEINAQGGKMVLLNHGYADKQQVEHSGVGGGPIETAWVVQPVKAKDANPTDT